MRIQTFRQVAIVEYQQGERVVKVLPEKILVPNDTDEIESEPFGLDRLVLKSQEVYQYNEAKKKLLLTYADISTLWEDPTKVPDKLGDTQSSTHSYYKPYTLTFKYIID